MNEDIEIIEDLICEYNQSDEEKIYRQSKSLENLIKGYRELEEYYKEQNEVNAKFISKSKLKEFFSSRLEKYQEADDGRYEQDYLTRGELELVDRYKECKEIAKIILEEEVNSEVPQDCIPKSKVKEKIEEVIRIIESEQFKIIMGDTTKCNRIKYILRHELMEVN